MVQQEVAHRIVARPGDLSLLAVSIQFYGQPRIVAHVPAKAFYPAPKVDSAILRIDVNAETPLTLAERDSFFKVVQAGFSERRNELHNAQTSAPRPTNQDVPAWLAADP